MDDSTVSSAASLEGETENTEVFYEDSGFSETLASVGTSDRSIMTTPLSDYTVTEGLLLCVLLLLLGRAIVRLADRFFNF